MTRILKTSSIFLSDFSCDVVRFLLKQAYATSTPDHPNNITFMCELKVLLNLLKVEFFVADNYEDYDYDIPNEDMFQNERSLDNHDVVKSFSKFDVTEIKIEPDIYGNVLIQTRLQIYLLR